MPVPDTAYDPELAARQKVYSRDTAMLFLEKERMEYLSPDWQPNEDWWGSQVTKD